MELCKLWCGTSLVDKAENKLCQRGWHCTTQSTSELHVAKPVIRMFFLLCGDASKIFKL